jgi:N-acetylmuramoyl-L-alanine amidase
MRIGASSCSRESAERPLWNCVVLVVVAGLVVLCLGQQAAASGAVRRATTQRREGTAFAVDPKLFEPGACLAYPPTSGDRHLTVFLDAGHGGIDPGSVGETESGQTIYEADETLPVELDAKNLLVARGYTVVVSRTEDESVSRPGPGDVSGGLFTVQGEHDEVAARDECADLAKANVLVGIYFDAGYSSYNAGSVTGYDADRPFATQNLRLATLVQDDVLDAMNEQGWQIPSLGVATDDQLGGPALSTAAADYDHLLLLGPGVPGWFSTPSTMPGALIEPLFITDPFEGTLAASTEGQEVIAGGLAQAVEQYFAPAHHAEAAPVARGHARHRT